MKHTTISTLLTTPVVLGTGNYGRDLTITATGGVNNYSTSGPAITGPATLGFTRIDNAGVVVGGFGFHGSGAGIALFASGAIHNTGQIYGGVYSSPGILLAAGGKVTNAGQIIGGSAGYYSNPGGAGVLLTAGGDIVNSGYITGGHDFDNHNRAVTLGDGGPGVSLTAAGMVTNSGTIAGGSNGNIYYGDAGGVGVNLAGGGVLRNAGTITGGQGGLARFYYANGGAGVSLGAAGEVFNTGRISGGDNGRNFNYGGTVSRGGDGIDFAATGTLHNAGTITGGTQYFSIGVAFSAGGTLVNTGTIAATGYGDSGVRFAGAAAVTNRGTITGAGGGNGGYLKYSPGAGLNLEAGGTLANWGLIDGGTAGYSGYDGRIGYTGGTGIVLGGPATASNQGTILGGTGGTNDFGGTGGLGGTGLMLSTGSTLIDTGIIAGGGGGTGGAGGTGGGAGGVGVYIDGGTLLARNGTIAGGAGVEGARRGDAVQFGGGGTLVLYARATLAGAVAADPAASDTLVLAGATTGTLTGFGSTVTGFTTITEQSGTHWHLAGNITGAGTLTIGSQGFLALSGSVSIATLDFATGGHAALAIARSTPLTSTLAGFGPGDTIDLAGITATALRYHAGTLSLLDGAQVVDTLHFLGDFKTADFTLHASPDGTEIGYDGPGPAAANQPWHFGFASAAPLWDGHTPSPLWR